MSHSAYPASRQTVYPPLLPLPSLFGAGGKAYEPCKRLIDVIASLGFLVVLMPVLLAVAASVRISGRGPILFKQKRLGRGGALFCCYKFRTMVPDAEFRLTHDGTLRSRFHDNYKIKNDPRVTRVGSFLRRTSLDELPQLWNVLRGDMSLIGPRPIVEPELARYGVQANRLLSVKPGLGGIWQVSGRSETSYADRVLMDMQYVESRSLGFDLKLLVLTALVVIRGDGAY
jgi:lipopolysaccharide/colanic/teichoic acid biosynthesis glycosyltransferase